MGWCGFPSSLGQRCLRAIARSPSVASSQSCKIFSNRAWARSDIRRNATLSRSCHRWLPDPGMQHKWGQSQHARVGHHMASSGERRASCPVAAEETLGLSGLCFLDIRERPFVSLDVEHVSFLRRQCHRGVDAAKGMDPVSGLTLRQVLMQYLFVTRSGRCAALIQAHVFMAGEPESVASNAVISRVP